MRFSFIKKGGRILSKKNLSLANLLEDSSFVNWLLDKGFPADNEKWIRWLNEDENHREIAVKARKLISMPFNQMEIDSNQILEELNKVRNRISKSN